MKTFITALVKTENKMEIIFKKYLYPIEYYAALNIFREIIFKKYLYPIEYYATLNKSNNMKQEYNTLNQKVIKYIKA